MAETREPIQVDADTWLIMRESARQPKAVVHRVNRGRSALSLDDLAADHH